VPTFLVGRVPGGAWVAGVDTREQPLWDEHAAFMDELFASGVVVLAGPVVDGGGAAVSVMDAASADEVRARLVEDPWVTHDILLVGEVREWRLFLDSRS
jgi:uncharacterized protein YciI